MSQPKSGRYWLALAAFVLALVAYARYHDLPGLYASYRHGEQQLRDLELRLETVKAEHQALEHSVEGLDSDPLAVEAAVRSSKRLVRKGETVYRVELLGDSGL